MEESALLVFQHLEEGVTDIIQGFQPLLCGGGTDGAFGCALGEDILLLRINDAGDDVGCGFYPGAHLLDDFVHGVLLGLDQTVDIVGEEMVQAAFVQCEQAVPVAVVTAADDDVAVYLSQTVTGFGCKAVDIVFDVDVLAFDFGQHELPGEFPAFLFEDSGHVDVVEDYLGHGAIRFLQ